MIATANGLKNLCYQHLFCYDEDTISVSFFRGKVVK